MTTITITKSSDDNFRKVECSGHTGFAARGEDVVCAAISVLTINTYNSIEKLTDDPIIVESDAGNALITIEFTQKPSKEADLLMRSFELGVMSIFEQYGKSFLNIKFRRV